MWHHSSQCFCGAAASVFLLEDGASEPGLAIKGGTVPVSREREGMEDSSIDGSKDSPMLRPTHCCNCSSPFQVWYSDVASQRQSSLQLC